MREYDLKNYNEFDCLAKETFCWNASTIDVQKLMGFWKVKSVICEMIMITLGYKTRMQLECEK